MKYSKFTEWNWYYVLLKLQLCKNFKGFWLRTPRKNNTHECLRYNNLFFLHCNWLQLDKTKNKWKIFYKEKPKKRQENTAQAHISLLSQIEQWKKSQEGGGRQRKKNEYIFKAKERNNIKTMVLKIYL